MRLQAIGDGRRDAAVRKHADLHRGDGDVGEYGVDLRADEGRRGHMDARHAAGVLRRQRGDDGHPVTAVGGKGFQIGLDAGAAGGIRAGNGQQIRDHGFSRASSGQDALISDEPAIVGQRSRADDVDASFKPEHAFHRRSQIER